MTKSKWHKVAELDDLAEGRVKAVSCGRENICLTRHNGDWGALANACPHQGGPLGEGSIEGGLLRCPWHGWDFDPLTGKPPGGYDDGVPTYPLQVRDDGVYVEIEEEQPAARTTSDVMVETMVNWGVDTVFGMVGHSNLGVADAMRNAEERGDLRYYGIRHEGAAAFAVSGYGKLTGRPAACFAIAGPGATNLLTGLWDANVDRAPALALTGQVPSKLIGRGAFQEVDLVAAYGRVAQWSTQVSTDSNHAELMTLACKSALLNRGVSHMVFPDDVQTIPSEAEADDPSGRMPNLAIAPAQESLDAALKLLSEAKRPVIVCGHGARFAMEGVIELAEKLRCPILTTFKAKGIVSDSHSSACGVLGRSGTPIASWFMNESDLLVVFGSSFSNHTGITDKKPIVQVDFDPMSIGRFHKVEVPVLGEIGVTAKSFVSGLGDEFSAIDQRREIAVRWKIWRDEKSRRLLETNYDGLGSPEIFAELTKAVPDNAILSVDVGNNAYAFGRYFECKNHAVLMSGYLGSIGFSFPAAMGAWAATQGDDPRFRGRKVVSISGDGGFGQYMAEITTAVKYKMNITHVLLNNGELGKISKEQRNAHVPVWQTEMHNPNFSEYAKLCGALGIRVTKIEELRPALEEALNHDGPALVEIISDVLLV